MNKQKQLKNQRRSERRGSHTRERLKKNKMFDHMFKMSIRKPNKSRGFDKSDIEYMPVKSTGFKKFILVVKYFFTNLVMFLVYRALAVYTWFLAKIGRKQLSKLSQEEIKKDR